jgi:hypothetical protein
MVAIKRVLRVLSGNWREIFFFIREEVKIINSPPLFLFVKRFVEIQRRNCKGRFEWQMVPG